MSQRDDCISSLKTQFDELENTAAAKIDALIASGDDAWESLANEVRHVRDALSHSFNYFKSQF